MLKNIQSTISKENQIYKDQINESHANLVKNENEVYNNILLFMNYSNKIKLINKFYSCLAKIN